MMIHMKFQNLFSMKNNQTKTILFYFIFIFYFLEYLYYNFCLAL